MKTQPSQQENAPQNTQPLTSEPIGGQPIWAFHWAGETLGYVWEKGTVLAIDSGRADARVTVVFPAAVERGRYFVNASQLAVDNQSVCRESKAGCDTFHLAGSAGIGSVYNEKLREAKL